MCALKHCVKDLTSFKCFLSNCSALGSIGYCRYMDSFKSALVIPLLQAILCVMGQIKV